METKLTTKSGNGNPIAQNSDTPTRQLNQDAAIANAEAIEDFFFSIDQREAVKFLFDQTILFTKTAASESYTESHVEEVALSFQILCDFINSLKKPYDY
jgi:hypothetical protein